MELEQINRDFKDLFVALSAAGARFLVVGGYAVALHGKPRYTKDLDIWVEPTRENAHRVLAALRAFGAPTDDLSESDLSTDDLIFQMGVPPSRVDILTSLLSVRFPEAYEHRREATYGGQPIQVISREDLIRNKRAVARPQDLVDADLLDDLADE